MFFGGGLKRPAMANSCWRCGTVKGLRKSAVQAAAVVSRGVERCPRGSLRCSAWGWKVRSWRPWWRQGGGCGVPWRVERATTARE